MINANLNAPFCLDMHTLTLVDTKDVGTKKGGIYQERSGIKWYVKVTEDLNIPEFLTSRVLQYLVPNNTSPVSFITDKAGWVASREITGFKAQIDVVTKGKSVRDEVKLTIALDFVRYIDRIRGNLGYIVDEENPRSLVAACVDYDLGFRFFWSEDHKTVWISLNHLDQLAEAIDIFGSYSSLSKESFLTYVDSLIAEAINHKGDKCAFDLSTFRQVVQTRLEKMADLLVAAKKVQAFSNNPRPITVKKLEKLNSRTQVLFKDKPTLLHLAATSGIITVVNALIKSGADLNAMDEQHETPLIRAVKGDKTEIALRLLQENANPNRMVHERPLHLAIMRDNVTLARALSKSYPYKTWTLIEKALEHKSTRILAELSPEWIQDANPNQKEFILEMRTAFLS